MAYNTQTPGRSSSQISIYDYPEHLNPFYEDDNHKRLRFWKLGSMKSNERRGSFTISSIKDLLPSFRLRKRSSTLGINKTSESPPPLRRTLNYDSEDDSKYNTFDPNYRNTVSVGLGDVIQRNTFHRSSMQDVKTSTPIKDPFFQRNLYRNTIQGRANRAQEKRLLDAQNASARNGSGMSSGISRTSVASSNPFDDEDDNISTISSATTGRKYRKKRRAPPPPTQNQTINKSNESQEAEKSLQETADISRLTAEIQSFVKQSDDEKIVRSTMRKTKNRAPEIPKEKSIEEPPNSSPDPPIETIVIIEKPIREKIETNGKFNITKVDETNYERNVSRSKSETKENNVDNYNKDLLIENRRIQIKKSPEKIIITQKDFSENYENERREDNYKPRKPNLYIEEKTTTRYVDDDRLARQHNEMLSEVHKKHEEKLIENVNKKEFAKLKTQESQEAEKYQYEVEQYQERQKDQYNEVRRPLEEDQCIINDKPRVDIEIRNNKLNGNTHIKTVESQDILTNQNDQSNIQGEIKITSKQITQNNLQFEEPVKIRDREVKEDETVKRNSVKVQENQIYADNQEIIETTQVDKIEDEKNAESKIENNLNIVETSENQIKIKDQCQNEYSDKFENPQNEMITQRPELIITENGSYIDEPVSNLKKKEHYRLLNTKAKSYEIREAKILPKYSSLSESSDVYPSSRVDYDNDFELRIIENTKNRDDFLYRVEKFHDFKTNNTPISSEVESILESQGFKKVDEDLIPHIREKEVFKKENSEESDLGGPPKVPERSVKEIIESINRSQSLLKFNHPPTPRSERYFYTHQRLSNQDKSKIFKNSNETIDKNLKDLSESEQKIKDLIVEMEEYNKRHWNDDVYNPVEDNTSNSQKIYFDEDYINNNLQCRRPGSSISSSTTEWNPIPKPRRSKIFENSANTENNA